MHVFIAGASGAIGRSLIPSLVERGHEVTATTRSSERARELETLGARAAVVDGLDREAVVRAVRAASPDAIVHQMTALRGMKFGRLDRTFAQTNRHALALVFDRHLNHTVTQTSADPDRPARC